MLGNASIGENENTRCPECGTLLIERSGYSVHRTKNLLPVNAEDQGLLPKCGECGAEIPMKLKK